MKLEVPKIALQELSVKFEELENFFSSWTEDFAILSIARTNLSEEMIVALEQWLEDNQDRDSKVKTCLRKLNSYKKTLSEANTKLIKRLVDVPALVKGYVQQNLPNQLLYKETDGVLLPYMVTDATYTPSDRAGTPASASIKLEYVSHGDGKRTSIGMDMSDIPSTGITIGDFLNKNGWVVETDELNDSMNASMKKYGELVNKVGSVYVGRNSGLTESERGWGSNKHYFKNDRDNKVVVDFKGYYESEKTSDKFKEPVKHIRSIILDGQNVQLPIHPYGHVFHLEEHVWIDVHVDNLTEYIFKGEELKEKLILPQKDKDIISILIEMSKMKIEDIVEGKSGGSFIISTGIPGTGKTLTAEVFSETVKKPIYKVQCSQLGIDVSTVERKLQAVLERASRWGAILLIDEADVYVRARGTDINQNAIVGTFLRTLEYYTGILFMTSNMETSIDDAIMSRATAHLVYGSPSIEDQVKIWTVLSKQFGVEELGEKEITEIVAKFPNLVGRDIKALLKLAIMYAKGESQKITIDTLETIHGFVPNVVKKKLS